MKKVWIILVEETRWYANRGTYVHRVFSTKEKAEEYLNDEKGLDHDNRDESLWYPQDVPEVHFYLRDWEVE